ncbi:MAG: NfeD family protein [Verrucomicrobiota bacterium]
MMDSLWLPLAFLVLGFLLLYLEFLLPGGIAGAGGCLLLAIGCLVSFFSVGPFWGLIVSVSTLVGGVILVKFWMVTFNHTFPGKQLSNVVEIDGTEQFEENQKLIGLIGEAVTDLHPSGKVTLQGKRYDVLAELGYIEAGSKVEVVGVEGSSIHVRSTPVTT